ncbi:hypothetical protein BT96DRAFT_1007506 [Gymnopus androsaceus JB14]|uniref:Uncharacterized protein n=1 Tax=Gymnopus androsaceus JB14 TaxID=1447944 RepID=A0A6A4GHM0_9AGAR|nr:hypothetical protein BT96DRAFT_1007506 [Gymnopus androsaceus JB14]
MAKRARHEGSDYPLELGRRVLRSKKEFSPYQLGPELVLQHIDTRQLFNDAYSNQQVALADAKGDPADTYKLNLHSSSFPSVLTPLSFQPLSSLVAPIFRAFSTKQLPPDCYLGLSAKEKAKLKARDAYWRKRNDERQKEMNTEEASSKGYMRHHVQGAVIIIVSDSSFSIRKNAWASSSHQGQAPSVLSSPDVFRLSGLKLIQRDGSITQIIRTSGGHRVMGLYASPQSPEWQRLMAKFDSLMEWLYCHLKLPQKLLDHQRGRYATIGVGYGFGGGRIRPGNYVNSVHNSELLQQALATAVVKRIARYVDCTAILTLLLEGLLALFPKLHSLYTSLDRQIVDVNNPNIHTKYHLDHWNYIGGMCAAFNGGSFDSKRSGHFIAWSLGLVIKFPPGTAIFVPSAAVPHSNMPLAKDE